MTHPTDPAGIFHKALRFIREGRPFAVATVLHAAGSTPNQAGAKVLIERDGTIHGTIGGGIVEAQAQKRALSATASGLPQVFECDLAGPGVHEPGPICGGRMRVLIDSCPASSESEYARAVQAIGARQRGLWVTAVQNSVPPQVTCRFVHENDLAREAHAAQLRACLDGREPRLLDIESETTQSCIDIFAEPIVPKPMLVIAGGGHVGQAVAQLASLVGFDITVFEDRPEFADPALFPPGTRTACADVARLLGEYPVGPDTYIVLVTRGHQQDSAALRACIGRPAAFIGMIGSRRKVPLVRAQFLSEGWATPAQFDAVYAPIGLDIGAVTVPEIATSIVAQLISVRRTGAAARIKADRD